MWPSFLQRFVGRLAELAPALLVLGLEGASLSLAWWALRSWSDLPEYVGANTLETAERTRLLIGMAASGGVAVLVGLAVGFASGRFEAFRTQRFAVRTSPLCLAAAVPFFFYSQMWRAHELTFLVMLALVGVAFQALLRRALDSEPVLADIKWLELDGGWVGSLERVQRRSWLPFLVVVVAATAYSVYFSWITIQSHYRLETASMDLGLENNLLWNAVHGGPLFKTSPLGGPNSTHGGHHQTYFAYVIGLVYFWVPGPETLLSVQSVILGFAAVPIYLLGRLRVGPWTGVFLALAYLLYPALHGPNLYEFHYLPLANFFLLMTLYCVESRRDAAAVLCALLTLSLREDVSALLAVLGLFVLVDRRRPVAGLLLMVVGAAYFVTLKLIVMPRIMGGASTFLDTFEGLLPAGESSFTGVLKTVIGNPVFALDSVLTKDKLVYLLQIMAPLAFLVWRRPIGFLLSIPGILFTILSTGYKPLIEIWFQYTSYWTAFVFAAAIVNLHWLRVQERENGLSASVRHAWVVTVMIASIFASHQYGAILDGENLRGGFKKFKFGIDDDDRAKHERLYKLIRMVPPDAKICSSERIVPHVSNRENSYTLRCGIYDAEYLLLWMPPSGLERDHFKAAFRDGTFGVIAKNGEFVLAKRGADPTENAAAIGVVR